MRLFKCYGNKLIIKELKGCYNFFDKEINLDKKSNGYGLIRDKSVIHKEIASVASVGYGLASLVVGVEHKWINYNKAYIRASRTLDTFLNNLENINGFFYHFVNINTAKREWNCELSIIDTAIFIAGAITAGEYFGGEVKEKADILYKNINWEWYRNKQTNQFYMGYSPEKGFFGSWDMYGEQLILYILGVAAPTYSVNENMYNDFKKIKGDYKDIKDIIYTYCGTIFTYQYSHCWINFMNKKDSEGIDWFENSIKATKASKQYCIDNNKKFKTYGENSWGLTSCVSPEGYKAFGAKPCLMNIDEENNGTIAPCGAIGSIVFTPKDTINAMENYYNNFPKLWCEYGFRDGYNLEKDEEWYSKECIGIDKGISLVMIENYLSGKIWNYFMKNKHVKVGLERLKIIDKNKEAIFQ